MKRPIGVFSGGPIRAFAGGWAVIPFARTPHYWQDISAEFRKDVPAFPAGAQAWKALCGHSLWTSQNRPALGVGNKKPCRRCMKKAPHWPNKQDRETFFEQDATLAAMRCV